MKKAASVDEYVKAHPLAVRKRLVAVRAVIQKAAPGAEEKISYGIPAYMLEGRLLYFAAHAEHIGVYPVTAPCAANSARNSSRTSRRTRRARSVCPTTGRCRSRLLAKVVKIRAKENLAR
jgi:uncharacterized protein YdhG (YjbR/CyaY superfamily)